MCQAQTEHFQKCYLVQSSELPGGTVVPKEAQRGYELAQVTQPGNSRPGAACHSTGTGFLQASAREPRAPDRRPQHFGQGNSGRLPSRAPTSLKCCHVHQLGRPARGGGHRPQADRSLVQMASGGGGLDIIPDPTSQSLGSAQRPRGAGYLPRATGQ